MEKTNKKGNAFAAFLDRKFRVSERGSSVSQEIIAGIGAFLVAVCALLMNTQMIGTQYGNYAGAYLAVSLIAFIGTMVMGFIANLPLMVNANMALSTVMISLLSTNTGLTYANVLAVTFLAAIISLVIAATPLKDIFVKALPSGVRKALPVGLGLYVAITALNNTGLLTNGAINGAKDRSELDLLYFWLMIAGTILLFVYLGAKRKNALGSTYMMLIAAMWVIGIVWFMEYFVGGQTATTLVYQRVNLIVATDGASPYNIVYGFQQLRVGELFREGFNFAAYTEGGGNAAMFIIESVLTFVCMTIYGNVGYTDAAMAAGEMEDVSESDEKKVLVFGSALNVISAILGGSPVSVAPQSAMAAKDGGKTGLAAVTAGIGFLIALFNWIFFAIMATGTNGVGMWINDTDTKLTAYVQDTFIFADLIMVFAGLAMLRAIAKVDTKNLREFVPFAATLFGMAVMDNFVLAIAFGVAAYVILTLLSKERKELNIAVIILCVVLVVFAVIALYYGFNYVTVQQFGPFGGPGGGPMPGM